MNKTQKREKFFGFFHSLKNLLLALKVLLHTEMLDFPTLSNTTYSLRKVPLSGAPSPLPAPGS